MEIVSRFFSGDSGSNAIEYGLIVALISLPVVTGAANASAVLRNMFIAMGMRVGVGMRVGRIAALSP